MSEENYFITYNSLISTCVLSENYDNSQYAKFLYAEENLEHSFYFKSCKKSFLDYSDIKGSLFYIRNIDECLDLFANKGGNSSGNKRQNLKEYTNNVQIELISN